MPHNSIRTLLSLMVVMATLGCAGSPRTYEPVADATPEAGAPLEAVVAACRGAGAAGDQRAYADVGAGAAGAAAGTGVLVAGIEPVLTGAVAGGAVVAAAAVAAPLSVYLVSRHNRNRAERRMNERMGECLREHGYVVTDWVLAPGERR